MHVYGLIDPRNNQLRYVGKTSDPRGRLYAHKSRKGKSHRANWIQQLKSEGLLPVMIVLETLSSDVDAYQAEREWISMVRSWGAALCNHADGGEGGFAGAKRLTPISEETRIRMSLAQQGKKLTEETKIKMKQAHLGKASPLRGRKQTPEHRAAISQGLMGHAPWSKGRKLTAQQLANRKKVRNGA